MKRKVTQTLGVYLSPEEDTGGEQGVRNRREL